MQCEADANVDVLIELVDAHGVAYRIGIEAKFNHELSRKQIASEASKLKPLVVLVSQSESVPRWLHEDHPEVPVITWTEALECFRNPRITAEDIASIKIPKATIEARLNALSFDGHLEGWTIEHRRNGNGNPSVVITSPEFAPKRVLCGQIQVVGRGVPASIDDVYFESHVGVEVPEKRHNYFNPKKSDSVPEWVENLRTLQREVLAGAEDRFMISRHAPGTSSRPLGKWKTPLALKHLGEHAYLAKGYTNGWAIGPKTRKVRLAGLDELAIITADLFERWYAAEVGARGEAR
ncbi:MULTISPECIES: hypothetical protein [Clavibacter]|uniref:Uncharacterized protein n=1 Tax=Clavibacter seminis TaxID=2860285 RepID=A0ABY3TCR2_9MICO|nr:MULTISPECIES: hypothetical protein [Clavibacter]UKF26712.1 hypothetical protein KYT88_15660 [Clavibacter sp. A6099]